MIFHHVAEHLRAVLKKNCVFWAALNYKLPKEFQYFVFEQRIFVFWIFSKFLQTIEVIHI